MKNGKPTSEVGSQKESNAAIEKRSVDTHGRGVSEAGALQAWKQLEDVVVPQLHLSVVDRAVYAHLVRHSRLEGKQRMHFSIAWLARGACVSTGAARPAVRRLVACGALRLVRRTKAGHVVEVRLPEEIRVVRCNENAARAAAERKARRVSRRWTSSKRKRCARPFMRAKAGSAFTVYGG